MGEFSARDQRLTFVCCKVKAGFELPVPGHPYRDDLHTFADLARDVTDDF